MKVDLNVFNIESKREYWLKKLKDLVEFRQYMEDYKMMIHRDVNKETEWRMMNEFITRLQGLMQFYDDLELLRKHEKECYQTVPLVQLSSISKSKYTDTNPFPMLEFKNTMTYLKKSVKEYISSFKTGHHKLDLLIRYDQRVDAICLHELPIMEMVCRVELRKEHFVNTLFEDLNITHYKDDVYFGVLVTHGICKAN